MLAAADVTERGPQRNPANRSGHPMTQFYKTMPTPVGTLTLVGNNEGLAAVLWENDSPSRVKLEEPVENPFHPILVQAEEELAEYFAGKRAQFDIKLPRINRFRR